MLYKYVYHVRLGYLVYRALFDLKRCSLLAGVEAHKVAVFVLECDAIEYCKHRNENTELHGTDEARCIKHNRTRSLYQGRVGEF